MQVNFIDEKATGLSKVSFIIQSQFTFGQGIINYNTTNTQRLVFNTQRVFIQKQSLDDIKYFNFQLLSAPEPICVPSSVIKKLANMLRVSDASALSRAFILNGTSPSSG